MKTLNRIKSRGVVSSEFLIVASAVLIPLSIIMPLMVKMVEVKQHSEIGARYSAWERTVWFQARPRFTQHAAIKSFAEIRNELQPRVLGVATTYIDYNQKNENNAYTMDVMLTGQPQKDGNVKAMIKPLNDDTTTEYALLEYSNKRTPGVSGAVMNGLFSTISALTGFELDMKGYHKNNVTLNVVNMDRIEEFENKNYSFSQKNVLLASGWNVDGPTHHQNLTQRLLPTTLLDNGLVRALQGVVGSLFFAREIRPSSLEFGHVDPEPVPEQRLGNY